MLSFKDEVCKPTKGSKYSSAVDLYAAEDCIIFAGETKIVGLGVSIDLDKAKFFQHNHYLQLEPRSSLRAKGILAGTGIIDLDYPDEIKLIIHGSESLQGRFNINKGDKIAQILLKEHKTFLLDIYTDDIRVGGFGSTGK